MSITSQPWRVVTCLGLLGLALMLVAGCVPGSPAPAPAPPSLLATPVSPLATAAPKPAEVTVVAQAPQSTVVVLALPAVSVGSGAAAAAAAAAATPEPTLTPTPVPSLTPSVPPTPSVTPTIIQGVKDTNVLVSVQLVRVIDGATIEVAIKGKNYQVRYLGIEAPAGGPNPAAWEAAALAGNKRLVTGQALRLEKDVTDSDSAGRLLRYVYTKTYMVNAEMVRYGYARAVVQAPDTRYQELFKAMEKEASAAKRGLWAATRTPVPPTATPGS